MILQVHLRGRRCRFVPVAVIVLAAMIVEIAPAIASAFASAETPASNSAAVDLDSRAYLGTLRRVSAAVQDSVSHPANIGPLRASLPKSWRVGAGEQQIELSTEWLDSSLAALQTNPATRASVQKDILGHLKILQEQAETLEAPGPSAPSSNARERLTAILQRSEFNSVQQPTWWESFTARVGLWVRRLLTKLFSGNGKRQTLRVVFVWTAIALLFIFLAWILSRALVRAAKHTALELGHPLPAGKSWRDWAQEALAAAKQSRFRDAIHLGYWAGIYRLQDLGALHLELARTPREYLRMLEPTASNSAPLSPSAANSTEYRPALARLTRKLERTWYGFEPATRDDFAETIKNLEALGCHFPSGQPTVGS